ncbi:MAG: GNAT family N-acetyltransferase [Gallionella sp.]|nr:GNAT family N-acetyltransferase [Gallionella sp.]
MITVSIIRKEDMTNEQRLFLDKRLTDPLHINDTGPPKCWSKYQSGLYVAIDEVTGNPFGIIEASGDKSKIAPGWWVDSSCRGKGYASAMIDELARYLKQEGFTGVGYIKIQTYQSRYDNASEALKRRFCNHFQSHVKNG